MTARASLNTILDFKAFRLLLKCLLLAEVKKCHLLMLYNLKLFIVCRFRDVFLNAAEFFSSCHSCFSFYENLFETKRTTLVSSSVELS